MTFPFVLGQCSGCGLIQFKNPIPPAELKAPFDWISYNEQEGHLDDLVAKVIKLANVSEATSVGAISYKDDSTVARFQTHGVSTTWRLDLAEDLGLHDPLAGLESIQHVLLPERASRIAERRGPVDVLIVRHILEHSHCPQTFAEALKRLVKPEGFLVFEVPDCHPALRRKDYSMPWEEHIAYFTPATFRKTLHTLGFHVVHYECYFYSNENSLIAIARIGSNKEAVNAFDLNAELELGKNYGRSFPEYQRGVKQTLANYRQQIDKIAVFGAGHLSCFWINVFNVGKLIDFVIDDHPKKKGMYMPGSGLPIVSSSTLLDERLKLCLLSLSPESEAKVTQKNADYTDQGGKFLTIFPGKPNSLPVL